MLRDVSINPDSDVLRNLKMIIYWFGEKFRLPNQVVRGNSSVGHPGQGRRRKGWRKLSFLSNVFMLLVSDGEQNVSSSIYSLRLVVVALPDLLP